MGSAMGADFSSVRIHTDRTAADMGNSIQAQAFTHGNDVYFNEGRYNPHSTEGSHLLAHELTHTVQQGASIGRQIQRFAVSSNAKQHGERSEMPAMPCLNHFNPDGSFNTPTGEQNIHFTLDSAGIIPGSVDDQRITAFATLWRQRGANATIELNGYASVEGTDRHNCLLSCNRAKAVENKLLALGIPNTLITVFANGETEKFASSLSPNRVVTLISAIPIPPEPIVVEKPKCGPDATSWFIQTVNNATVDPRVLHVQTLLRRANAALALVGVALNTDKLAEAGSTAAIAAQLLNLGSAAPASNPTIRGQLTRGAASTTLVASNTISASRLQLAAIATATALVGAAAFSWKHLVDHGAPFDFKAHIMNHPHSSHCPDEGCVSAETGVITLCPGSAPENCYESDITGNIFYALIGRFIGWSELTLQLGSQLAELTDSRRTPIHPVVTWDTPDDTAGIHLGFHLPLPLTNSALCGMLAAHRSALSIKIGCADCTEIFIP